MFEGVTLGERYQVFGRIGGSSCVIRYDGVDALLARTVDIVTLTAEAARDPDLRDQFEALGRAAATRSHPHIIDVYDLGAQDDRPFIVTEHLSGEPLRAIIEEEAPFHPDDAVALVQQLAAPADNEATRATGGGMVSVDTVVVDASGVAKHSDLLTFGERYAAAQDGWSGRPPALAAPMAPVAAIAAIAYELLTGQTPAEGPRSARPSAINGAVTPDIDRIVLRALDPRLRDFPSATAFANALTAAARRARDVREPAAEQTRVVPRLTPPPPVLTQAEGRTQSMPVHAPFRDGPVPAPVLRAPAGLDDEDEPFERSPSRGIPWTWMAIALLTAMVLALGIARLRDNGGSPSRNAASTQESAANDLPVTVQDPTNQITGDVPDVTGRTRDAAAAELANQGLILQEGVPITSDTVAPGAVVEQNPKAGAAVPGNRTVDVRLSRGPATVDLAALELTGKDAAQTKQLLDGKGFAVQIREEGSQSVPAGDVIALEPDGTVAPGTAVTVVVSVGDKVQIPRDIFSMPVQDAEAKLGQAGIELAGTIAVGPAAIQGRIDPAQYQIVSGDVIGVQNPQGDASFGGWVARGSSVTLVYYDASS